MSNNNSCLLDKRKKVKDHTLDASQKQYRKTNCRKLYEKHLAGNMSEYAVTLDEALVYIYIDDSNGKRQICYVKHGEKVPERWVFEKKESFKKGVWCLVTPKNDQITPKFGQITPKKS
jgi:hypothetical protein